MRVSTQTAARLLALGAAVVAVALVLDVCAATSSASAASTHVAPATRVVAADAPVYPGVRVVRDLVYDRVHGEDLKLDVCLPPEHGRGRIAARPAILSIHGGSWAHGAITDPDWMDVCQWLASSGYVTASVEYELAPEHPYPAAITEIERAVEWLRERVEDKRFAIDPALIGAFGGSAGGNLAALLGTLGHGSTTTGHRVSAVAELSGPTNLTGSGLEQADFYPYVLSYLHCAKFSTCPQAVDASPLYHVDKTDPPFFIGQSSDERIPLVQSTSFVKRLVQAGVDVTFVTIVGHKHSISMLDSAMRARIIEFFRAKLHSKS